MFFQVRDAKGAKNVNLGEATIRALCLKAREVLLGQPSLLELEAPLKIVGEDVVMFVLRLCDLRERR